MAIIFFFDLSIQVRKTSELVFLLIVTVPIISSLSFVGAINLISSEIVTHDLPLAQE